MNDNAFTECDQRQSAPYAGTLPSHMYYTTQHQSKSSEDECQKKYNER
jgi:hypothetical protein